MLPNLPFRTRYTSSKQLISGQRVNDYADLLTSYGEYAALANGGFPNAPTLNYAFSNLITVATANDSAALPLAKAGLSINVTNNGVASANIFPQPLDVINAVAAGGSVALGVGASATFVCVKTGFWRRFVSA